MLISSIREKLFTLPADTVVLSGHGPSTTIGAEKDESPVLGDNVFVGAGAKIVGAVRIGSNVKIGANAVVVDDIPDGATAVGIPAKVIGATGDG